MGLTQSLNDYSNHLGQSNGSGHKKNASGAIPVSNHRRLPSIRTKQPMPELNELEQRFTKILASMDLPPDKAKLLKNYDKEKKWDIICDQEMVHAKDPPSYYLNKLRTYLDPKASRSHRKRKMVLDSTSTQVLRDLEISLRTNNIEWVREFLSEENRGLDVLVDYLNFRLMMMRQEQRIKAANSEESILNYSTNTNQNGCASSSINNGTGTGNGTSNGVINNSNNNNSSSMSNKIDSNSSSQKKRTHANNHVVQNLMKLQNQNCNEVSNHYQNSSQNKLQQQTSKHNQHLGLYGSEQYLQQHSSHNGTMNNRSQISDFSNNTDSPTAKRRSKHVAKLNMGEAQDDIHLCILCLRAIMNNKYGYNRVISHQEAINYIALSLVHRSLRTKALVLELLAAVCLVKGGHAIIIAAFDNFKEAFHERHRFQTLMDYFMNYEAFHIEFMVACMQFVNIVVHSVNDLNFRVHLQYEFTILGLDDYLKRLRLTESEQLQTQISAFYDNVFDVSALMDDSETKTAALEKVAELEEELGQAHERISEIERDALSKLASLESELSVTKQERDELLESRRQADEIMSTLKRAELESKKRQSMLESKILELETISKTSNTPSSATSVSAPAVTTANSSTNSQSPSINKTVINDAAKGANNFNGTGAKVMPPPPPPPPLPFKEPAKSQWNNGNGSGTSSTFKNPSSFIPNIPIPPPPAGYVQAPDGSMTIKRKVQTKYKLPTLNWIAMKPNQVRGTIFNELDDDKLHNTIDFNDFEERFKIGINGTVCNEDVDGLSTFPSKRFKKPENITLLEHTRLRNIAISRRKLDMPIDKVTVAINSLDLKLLSLENVELLQRMAPTDQEVKAYKEYGAERKNVNLLTEEDKFLLQLTRVERISTKLAVMNYIGNFFDNLNLISPQVHAIISASSSVKNSKKLRSVLEVILAFGNYMNSSKRGPAYGFKLQSLDTLMDTKSNDKRMCLMHYIAATVRKKFPELLNFDSDLLYIEKAALVSMENLVVDIQELEKGMDQVRKEYELRSKSGQSVLLRDFLANSEEKFRRLKNDLKLAQDAFRECVEYFGESPRTTDSNHFFALFVRFAKTFKAADVENEQRLRLEHAASRNQKNIDEDHCRINKANQKKQQEAVINELKYRAKSVQEKKLLHQDEVYNGALEDILLGLKSEPYRRADAVRRSQRRKFDSNRLSKSIDEYDL